MNESSSVQSFIVADNSFDEFFKPWPSSCLAFETMDLKLLRFISFTIITMNKTLCLMMSSKNLSPHSAYSCLLIPLSELIKPILLCSLLLQCALTRQRSQYTHRLAATKMNIYGVCPQSKKSHSTKKIYSEAKSCFVSAAFVQAKKKNTQKYLFFSLQGHPEFKLQR